MCLYRQTNGTNAAFSTDKNCAAAEIRLVCFCFNGSLVSVSKKFDVKDNIIGSVARNEVIIKSPINSEAFLNFVETITRSNRAISSTRARL